MGELYCEFASLFPASAALWQMLAQEEAGHADLAREVQLAAQEQEVVLQVDRFDLADLTRYLGRLREHLAGARAGAYTETQALQLADTLENSLIEQRFFEIAAASSDALQRVFAQLAEGTTNHRERIRKYWREAHER